MGETLCDDGFCEWEGNCETCPIEVDECPYQWNGKRKMEVIEELEVLNDHNEGNTRRGILL